MSEQPERVHGWVIVYGDRVSAIFPVAPICGSHGRAAEITELRPGEAVVGPLEMAVLRLADAMLSIDDWQCDLRNYHADRDAIARNAETRAGFFAAVRALREARKPKEPSNG